MTAVASISTKYNPSASSGAVHGGLVPAGRQPNSRSANDEIGAASLPGRSGGGWVWLFGLWRQSSDPSTSISWRGMRLAAAAAGVNGGTGWRRSAPPSKCREAAALARALGDSGRCEAIYAEHIRVKVSGRASGPRPFGERLVPTAWCFVWEPFSEEALVRARGGQDRRGGGHTRGAVRGQRGRARARSWTAPGTSPRSPRSTGPRIEAVDQKPRRRDSTRVT